MIDDVDDFLERRWEDVLNNVDAIDTARVVAAFNEHFKIEDKEVEDFLERHGDHLEGYLEIEEIVHRQPPGPTRMQRNGTLYNLLLDSATMRARAHRLTSKTPVQ